jgi:hypothetical protein
MAKKKKKKKSKKPSAAHMKVLNQCFKKFDESYGMDIEYMSQQVLGSADGDEDIAEGLAARVAKEYVKGTKHAAAILGTSQALALESLTLSDMTEGLYDPGSFMNENFEDLMVQVAQFAVEKDIMYRVEDELD